MIDHFIAISALIISIGAFWGIISKNVRDGVIGKIILFFMSVSAFAIFTKAYRGMAGHDISEATLLTSVAFYWIRHIWLVLMWHPLLREYYKKNPHRERRKTNRE